MKACLLSICGLIGPILLWGQSVKVYPDAASFKNAQPIVLEHVAAVRRTDIDMSTHQGGPYKMIADGQLATQKLRYEYWGVESDSTLYLNSEQLFRTPGYIKVLYRTPEFLYLRVYEAKARPPVAIIVGGGVIGAAITGATLAANMGTVTGTNMSHKYKEYLVYIEWGEVMPLTKRSFTGLLQLRKDTVLLNQYQKEENPTDTATYFKYMNLMYRK